MLNQVPCKPSNLMTRFPAVLITVKTATTLLQKAANLAPAASNLRDELEVLTEHCKRLENALADNDYDLAGMER